MSEPLPGLRIAIVADGLATYGGAERVIECILRRYPAADLFALVDFLPKSRRGWLQGRHIRTSFLQELPWSRHYFRSLLSLWPIAVEQFDLSCYDLVISSQFAVAHGALTGPFQTHVTYTHSPMRYAWDLQAQYLREAGLERGPLTLLARPMLHRLRMWDAAAAARVDALAANSAFVAERIRKYYRRDSAIIYPPVFLDRFAFQAEKQEYFLTMGRLVPYKRVDLIVEAFAAMPDRTLVVAGDGPMLKALQRRATPNVRIIGPVNAGRAQVLMADARAFVFAAIEDFGIAPVEAQASGTPVIGLGVGGLCETVSGLESSRPTGVFFMEQTVEAICEAVERFEQVRIRLDPADCRANAERFAPQRFSDAFDRFVHEAVSGCTCARSSSLMPFYEPVQRGTGQGRQAC
jgi:glycosyltransferase involved in cell wall biosynthesis